MEHNMHANLHWGYGSPTVHSTPQSHWVPPPPSNSLKRAISESDCEELFSEESSEKQISPSESGGVHNMSRKKRRGVIEKKRRDRINSSLSELKRLVPSAYEKQGSAKLEKAEILQLTVEHLKNLNSKGMDSLNFDAQRFAMDYHIIGFRECAAEVARYLVTIEGMDIQDPLRLRLMSHLQYFVQQRELSAKTCTGSSTWTAPPNTATNMYQNNCTVAPYQAYPATTSTYVPNLPVHPYPALSSSPSASHIHQHQQHQQHTHQQHQPNISHRQTIPASVTPTNDNISLLNQTNSPQANAPHAQPAQVQITTTQATHEMRSPTHQQAHSTHSAHQHHYAPQQTEHHGQDHNQASSTYIELTSRQPTHVNNNHRNRTPEVTSTGVTYAADTQYPDSSAAQAYNQNANLQYVGVNGAKPYRPWGAEMAY